MARVKSGFKLGHQHTYTDKASSKNRATEASITQGHTHRVVRDDAGRALRLERSDGHTHNLR